MLPSQRKISSSKAIELELAEESGISIKNSYELMGRQPGGRESLDVVGFDTTYRTNKENRPLAGFVGFNHHREIIIFGVVLIYDETTDSFIWLFETFLEAISKYAPKIIFTDQDIVMAKDISSMMPNTYHRLYTWYIMQNALKKVNQMFRGPDGVNKVLSKFIYCYDKEDEFLAAWDKMLIKYNLHENDWFKRTFEVKKKWTYKYVKWIWSA
ncbi:hypothetical protein Ddye_020952 [Dipteronia dyeriana]|uniref:MULE transposase domain-containing protein n=1 Tax=Dipteronia dyeriana TaxID=168575 RepID=A0AAD9U0V6_9ROSI|nr:hypothetical protein Ddye_020952 [Dipteronia dyeriana]